MVHFSKKNRNEESHMLTFDDVLNLNYYKKTSYTGWINGMRFLIKQEETEEGDAIFHAWVVSSLSAGRRTSIELRPL